jgi:aspartate-semialdehyde dehydrogenase
MKKVAVVGCTGAVGMTMLQLLEDTDYEVVCMASERSAGKRLKAGNTEHLIEPFSVEGCASCDIVFLCVSGSFALEYGERLAENSYVIDNSSAFRYHPDIPLLVPPINGQRYKGEKLIANPNCSSAIALMVLGPLHDLRARKRDHFHLSGRQWRGAARHAGAAGKGQGVRRLW